MPSDGFIEVLRDADQAVPEYLPISLLGTAPTGGLTPVIVTGGPPEYLSGDAVVFDVTLNHSYWETTGAAQDASLPDGTVVGQIKRVTLYIDLGDGLVTPTNGHKVSFTAVGQTAEWIWTGSIWFVYSLYNMADGANVPLIVA